MQARTRIPRPGFGSAASPEPARERRLSGGIAAAPTMAGAFGHSFAAINVLPRLPQIQRMDVAIDEISSQVRATDQSQVLSPAVQAEVVKAIVGQRGDEAETPPVEELLPDTPAPIEDPYEDDGG